MEIEHKYNAPYKDENESQQTNEDLAKQMQQAAKKDAGAKNTTVMPGEYRYTYAEIHQDDSQGSSQNQGGTQEDADSSQNANVPPTPTDPNARQDEPKEAPRKGGRRWLQAAGLGLIFGVVAVLAYYGTTYVIQRVTEELTPIEEVVLTTGNAEDAIEGRTGGTDIVTIAENTLPSIVSITNMSVQEIQSWFGGSYQQEVESMGSGIIVAQSNTELLVVTNNHVVEGNQSLAVTFIDEESVYASVKGTDADLDVAVIAIDISDIKASTREAIAIAQIGDSTTLKVGEPVIAIGNALGYGQSVTSGIVSALDREIDGYDGTLIQTDAAINPGNSGGALLNAKGEVIGINVAKLASEEIEGMGYAIPISNATDIISDLMNRETRSKVSEAERGYLGITGYDVTSDSAQMYGMPVGVYVHDVVEGGAAEKAGITKGSIITKFDGNTIQSMSNLQEQLSYYKVGETVDVVIEKMTQNGEYEETTVSVTLGSMN